MCAWVINQFYLAKSASLLLKRGDHQCSLVLPPFKKNHSVWEGKEKNGKYHQMLDKIYSDYNSFPNLIKYIKKNPSHMFQK